jgi:hypothetical protein
MRFDYGRVKALFMYQAAAKIPFDRVNAYICRCSKKCILAGTHDRQSPDTSRVSSETARGAIQEYHIR